MKFRFKSLKTMEPNKVINKLISLVRVTNITIIDDINDIDNINLMNIRLAFIKFLNSVRTEYCISFMIKTIIYIIKNIFRKFKSFQDLIDKLRNMRYLESNNKFVDNMILCSHLNILIQNLKNIYLNHKTVEVNIENEIKNPNPEFFKRVSLIDIWDLK